MDLAKKHWGDKEQYNTDKSAFWRVIKSFINSIYSEQETPDINLIAWSDIYKVALDKGGNPSARLINEQWSNCINIVKHELRLYRPRYAIFLTGHGYAKSFIKELFVKNDNIKIEGNFVSFVGAYNDTKVIVSEHPQGKTETGHVEELVDYISKV